MKQEFTQEYKEKLDFLMQNTDSPKLKEVIAKLYGLPQHAGEVILDAVAKGVF